MKKAYYIYILIVFLFVLPASVNGAVNNNPHVSLVSIDSYYTYLNGHNGDLALSYTFWGLHDHRNILSKYSFHGAAGYRFVGFHRYVYSLYYNAGCHFLQKGLFGVTIGGVHYFSDYTLEAFSKTIHGISFGVLYSPLFHSGIRLIFQNGLEPEFFIGFKFHLYSINHKTGKWYNIFN